MPKPLVDLIHKQVGAAQVRSASEAARVHAAVHGQDESTVRPGQFAPGLSDSTEGEEAYLWLHWRPYELLNDKVPYYVGSVQKERRVMELLFILKLFRCWHNYKDTVDVSA